jgi:hypothetical protein
MIRKIISIGIIGILCATGFILFQQKSKNKPNTGILQLAEEGRFDTYNFKMGDSIEKVKEELGEPIAEAGNDGAFSYVYNNLEVFYGPLRPNKDVLKVDFRNGKIYGLEINKSTIKDIKDVLGEPYEMTEIKMPSEEERERIIEEGGIVDGAYEYWTEDGYKYEEDDVVSLDYKFSNQRLEIYTKEGIVTYIMYYTIH